jgi:hypothetical protein
MHAYTTIEELLEVVLFIKSALRLYNEDQWNKLVGRTTLFQGDIDMGTCDEIFLDCRGAIVCLETTALFYVSYKKEIGM